MKLKIKDMANVVNCTVETLRFYEKENVVLPKREPGNNYRYYDVQNLKILSKCVFLRSLKFSVKETIDIMSSGTVDNVLEVLRSKEDLLIEESNKLLSIIEKLSDYRKKIEEIPDKINKFSIVERPELLLFINQHNDHVYSDNEYLVETANILKCFPFVNSSIMVKEPDVLNENNWSRYLGYSIDSKSQFYEEFKGNALMEKLLPRKCLYTIKAFNLTKDSKTTAIKSIRNFIEKNNYVVNGDMIGNQLFVDNEKYLNRKLPIGQVYYEYWIPVE